MCFSMWGSCAAFAALYLVCIRRSIQVLSFLPASMRDPLLAEHLLSGVRLNMGKNVNGLNPAQPTPSFAVSFSCRA